MIGKIAATTRLMEDYKTVHDKSAILSSYHGLLKISLLVSSSRIIVVVAVMVVVLLFSISTKDIFSRPC